MAAESMAFTAACAPGCGGAGGGSGGDSAALWAATSPRQPGTPPPAPQCGCCRTVAPRQRQAAPAAPGIASLPLELLGAIVEEVLRDDAQQQRRPVVQFAGRAWLAAYRCAAYHSVRLDLGAALRALRTAGLSDGAAAAAALQWLAARLPHAAEMELWGVPLEGAGAPLAPQLRWHLGELLLRTLGPSTRLRRLSLDALPHLPLLLEQRRAAGLRLEALGITALPAASLLQLLPALRAQPLCALDIADAASLGDGEGEALAAALASLPSLATLRLGGCGRSGAAAVAPGPAPAAQAGGAAGGGQLDGGAGVCLPSLQLVAAAAALPGLQQLELSLTFGRRPTALQQEYLYRLGAVLHSQRRHAEAAAAGGGGQGAQEAGPRDSRVSVIVHEHVQGDLSAVPVASCSLNLDWDDESNPIEVWQCSTLRRLRIAAQLPVQAGQFRPACLAALEVLQISGCCHIPAYFAEALCSMAQLSVLELSECLLEAVAAVPWQQVLPRLGSLQEVAIERCSGAALLPALWHGLAGCSRLQRLAITGGSAGGGLPPAPPAPAAPLWLPGALAGGAPAPPCLCAALPGHQAAPPTAAHRAACPQAAAATVPPAIALLQQLRCLDLRGNDLASLPDGLAFCQHLTSVHLAGNRLQAVPLGLAALGGLRKLDLSRNQLACLAPGPYLQRLEELQLGGNLPLHPSALPLQLLQRRRLRRLGLPLWWRLAGCNAGLAPLLLALCPWLLLEHRC